MADNANDKDLPEGIDLERPNAARVYDYLLGGTANWAVDRVFADQALKGVPLLKPIARVNRDFLGRAVRYCLSAGINQFLDIGSGVPTVGNVHEIANEVDPQSRCVYVDYEPVAVAHSRVLLEKYGDSERHAVVQGDARDVEQVWKGALSSGVLDPSRPICLTMVALLHFLPDDEQAQRAVAAYRDLLPPGSALVISHITQDGLPPQEAEQAAFLKQQYSKSSTPVQLRDRAAVTKFFGDFDLVDPGLVWVPQWRPELSSVQVSEVMSREPAKSCLLGGVALKR